MRDKAYDWDILWSSPRLAPRFNVEGTNFDDHLAGGWDEVFPCIEKSTRGPGQDLPYMGEIWSQPAEVSVLESSSARVDIELNLATPVTPLRLSKRISIQQDSPVVTIAYSLKNVGYLPFDFNLGLHPMQTINDRYRFDIPAISAEVESGNGPLGSRGDHYTWPILRGISIADAMPPSTGCFGLHRLTDLQAGWVAATDTSARRGFGMVFDAKLFNSVELWLVYGGWRGMHHAILQPWTGYAEELKEAVGRQDARRLDPGEVLTTEVHAVAYDGVSGVKNLSADGRVESND